MQGGISASVFSAGTMIRTSRFRAFYPVWNLPVRTYLNRQYSSQVDTPPIQEGAIEHAIEEAPHATSTPQQQPRTEKMPMSVRTFIGVITSAGKMSKTAKVRIVEKVWNNHVRKYFFRTNNRLVHDPASAVREGDIVRVAQGFRSSKHKRCVVTEIVAPFGTGERPAPIGLEDIEAEKQRKREAKQRRRKARKQGLDVEEMGLKTTVAEGDGDVSLAKGIQGTLYR